MNPDDTQNPNQNVPGAPVSVPQPTPVVETPVVETPAETPVEAPVAPTTPDADTPAEGTGDAGGTGTPPAPTV